RRRFQPYGYTPLLRREEGNDQVVAIPGVIPEGRTGNPLVNVLLFVLTVLTTLAAGGELAGQGGLLQALLSGDLGAAARLALAGAPFSFTLLIILGVHEFGHYAAARLHRVTATLPYFIPMPVGGLGTLGAFISVRSPMKNRTVLFDIGLAGPLAGFVVAVPLLVTGILLSEPVAGFTPGLTQRVLGSSVLVRVIDGFFSSARPGQTLSLHPVYFAAWLGLLITGINLLPIGQLDGGHVAYALFGRSAHYIARGTLLLLIAAGLLLSSTWLLWAVFALFGGLHHPPPLNDIAQLDSGRWLLGLSTIGLFFLMIVPVPFV
ncbi:MAG: site-2 protease family protein, partial [Anaerolineae bacterium]|nr:site-2 protease family protein [Anaerolineae bacterium]